MGHGLTVDGLKSRDVVTAIAEISSQIIDDSYKCKVCNQFNIIEEHKKEQTAVCHWTSWSIHWAQT